MGRRDLSSLPSALVVAQQPSFDRDCALATADQVPGWPTAAEFSAWSAGSAPPPDRSSLYRYCHPAVTVLPHNRLTARAASAKIDGPELIIPVRLIL